MGKGRMGNSDSKPACSSDSIDAGASKCPVKHIPAPSAEGACPIKHPAAPSSCPFASDTVDPLNQMPPANQLPAPDQKGSLPVERQLSSIPRATDKDPDARWVYPSEQMFYNAMRRKGWTPSEDDMAAVVAIHNFVNEHTWRELLRWERDLHGHECGQPKLVRFTGRPTELSPKARIYTWFGYTAPFDRHDWIVDRCGQEVRYIIDFYPGPEMVGNMAGPPRVEVDVRPASFDSIGNSWDVCRMTFRKFFEI
eukprot:TRINITY_DN2701_c0_g1::TRINITY_DN2701_c0_g1_i2::g.25928::m.25928 TRINITY_DN2701_c0_g1::TRINITY_DN2701_c0_g1_i2::g.25928  ORF type:complete len:252 (+),score=-4.05,sp/Q5F339/CCHL_CHICK/49.77/4e-60,Cyto_heme_lyase/PF01265.12/3.2e-72 TRINITY_DN2701_c0_g1_i2:18-773(+)